MLGHYFGWSSLDKNIFKKINDIIFIDVSDNLYLTLGF